MDQNDNNSHYLTDESEQQILELSQTSKFYLFDNLLCLSSNSSYVSSPTPQLILPLQITYPIATTDKLTGMLMPYQTLTEGLNGFSGTECVKTSTCVDCKKDGKLKTIRIFEISPVIFIQLKRFNSQNDKLTIPIKFEPKLNLNRYLGSDRLSSLSDYLL
ncbi:unnamed protein product, partial [Didymodactylos carnosus]